MLVSLIWDHFFLFQNVSLYLLTLLLANASEAGVLYWKLLLLPTILKLGSLPAYLFMLRLQALEKNLVILDPSFLLDIPVLN